MRPRQTRAERTQAARERAAGHASACTCRTEAPANGNWFAVRNFVDQPSRAAIYIYEEIGYWGTSANEFVQMLNGLNVTQLDVHINSPGGEVDDGVAIFNAIRQHPAHVTVYIDGLAASAASFIACAGDEVLISEFAQVMIHDAMGIEFGNAAEMRAFADLLDRYSDNIAGIYAQQAGGTAEQWREAMRVETWYTGPEAVAAGLADRVHDLIPDDGDDADRMATARWDLSLYSFRHQGRAAAPAPRFTAMAESAPAAEQASVPAEDAAPTPVDTTDPDAPSAEPAIAEAADTGESAVDDAADNAEENSDRGTSAEPDVTADDALDVAPDAADQAADIEPSEDGWALLTASLTAPAPDPAAEFAALTEALRRA